MNYRQWNIPKFILAETVAAFQNGRHETFVIWTAAFLEELILDSPKKTYDRYLIIKSNLHRGR